MVVCDAGAVSVNPRRAAMLACRGGDAGGGGLSELDQFTSWQASAPDSVLKSPGSGHLCDADELFDGLVIADQAGLVTVFNSTAERLTGISAEKALGQELSAVLPLADGDGRCWWGVSRPYDGLSIRTMHPERPMFLPDGTELLVTVGYVRWPRRGVARATDDSPGEPGAVRKVIVTLRSAERRARAERLRADLVSTVAHELRSPLTSVKGFTATLLAKWPRFTDDQKRVMLETVNADADRVTRLIAELLDVSRIEAGRVEVRRELVDIGARAAKIVAGRVAAGDQPVPDRGRQRVGMWLDAIVARSFEPHQEAQARCRAGYYREAALELRGGSGARAPRQGERRAERAAGVQAVLAREAAWRWAHLFTSRTRRQRGGGLHEARRPGGGAEFRFTMPAGLPDHC